MCSCSNNTNKFNPQEHSELHEEFEIVQIIQINSILKNWYQVIRWYNFVQIIQINSILKNFLSL